MTVIINIVLSHWRSEARADPGQHLEDLLRGQRVERDPDRSKDQSHLPSHGCALLPGGACRATHTYTHIHIHRLLRLKRMKLFNFIRLPLEHFSVIDSPPPL